jgi:ethanolamine utilization microcompartment shell protein EutL
VRVIEVTWWDAWISTEDIKIAKAKKLKPVKRSTVGYLVADCDDWIVLSTDRYHKGKEVNAPMVIPKGMILETYEYVKEKK